MALIALEGVHFYAYHGFYEEEQIIGNNFILDVYVEANTGLAARTDDLFSTVNYETIYRICQMEMRTTTTKQQTNKTKQKTSGSSDIIFRFLYLLPI